MNAIGSVGRFAKLFVIGWGSDSTGGFSCGLVMISGGVLLTVICAVLNGHNANTEHDQQPPCAPLADEG
jgi:hypothetical protein